MSGQDLLQTIEALIAEKRWDDAVSIATTALASDPRDPRLSRLLADAQLGAAGSAEARRAAEAAAAAQEAARLQRQQAAALEELASQQLSRGRLDDAEATAGKLVRLAPEWAESFNTRGGVLLKRKQLERAESDFREALRLAPNEPVYMNNLGLALHRLGKRKEAIEWFRRAATQDPTFATARNNLYTSTRFYLWGGGAMVLVLSIALHAAFSGSRGGTSGRDALLVAGGVLALLVPALFVRYWLRKRSLDPVAQNLYRVEGRRARRRLDERTVVRAAGFLLLVAACATAVLTRQTQLATVFVVLAVLWLHRGWTVWRFATGWIQR